MPMNPREPFFDRIFGPGCSEFWSQKVAWETQKAAWKAQRHAQRAAWKAQREAEKAERSARWLAHRWYHQSPFAAVWGMLWAVFWIGFLVLLVVSPEFRTGFVNFMLAIPKFVVHLMHALAGRAEI